MPLSIRALLLALFVLCSSTEDARAATSKPTSTPSTKPTQQAKRTTPLPVWIDADPAVGMMGKDVDDGFALIQSFHSKELAIRGVSVVFGNSPLHRGYPITQKMMKLLKVKGIPVVPGAASHKELGKKTKASEALAAALRKEKLTLLVLGPATNVATVLMHYPKLAGQIVELVSVAGRRPGQKFLTGKAKSPHRDYNFECDPKAYDVLLKSKIPLVFAPWEISSKLWLRSADLNKLQRAHAIGRWIAGPAKWWLFFWKSLFQVDGFNPFDTLAVGYLTSRHLLRCEHLPMKITRAANDTPNKPFLGKEAKTKLYLTVDKRYKKGRKVLYCHTPQKGFHADLMKRLLNKP